MEGTIELGSAQEGGPTDVSSIIQLNGTVDAPTAYTTQDGETIIILPQYSTLVLTGEDATGVPVEQYISSAYPDNGGAESVGQLPDSRYYVSLGGSDMFDISQTEALPVLSKKRFMGINDRVNQLCQRDGSFQCYKCSFTCKKSIQMKRHLESHDKEKPYHCQHCTASFNLEKNLVLHEASHNLTPNSSCPICDKRFLRVAGLCSHLRIHQVEDVVTCDRCKTDFEHISG